ncbi:RNA ligase family protein [Nonomuraea sp. LPB2021202275-12-8]|uniref:RNA ligase family protein n=1 Tax=Nonomuraea sp. LPB2021202275-12-8 TaxID=3120159 RepID=UPI00300DB512
MTPEDLRIPELLRKLNSATKYPSIPTYHAEAGRGRLFDEVRTPFPPGTPVRLEEKVNGWNARLILGPGWYLIGSREDVLHASGDVVFNPEGGVVEKLGAVADLISYDRVVDAISLDRPAWPPVITLHMEVYGRAHSVKGWESYGDGSEASYRLFDVAVLDPVHLDWDIERIASWRDQGGQNFMPSDVVDEVSQATLIPRVPHLTTIDSSKLPVTVEYMTDMLVWHSTTRVAVNGAPGEAEGVILRTPSRSVIAKTHLARYRRSLEARAEEERLQDKAVAKAARRVAAT